MKTALEIAEFIAQNGLASDKLIKNYAKQVAYEALKSAADIFIGKPVKDINGMICAVSDDIMDTEIVTL